DMRAAVKSDGTVLAIKFRNIENEGAGIDFAARHNLLMLSNIANCYRMPAVSYEGYSVVTNRCPVVANRGIGKPFMCFAVERMVDVVAAELGLDPVAVRLKNFLQPDQFPYDTPSGQTYDSGDYPALAQIVADELGLRPEQVRTASTFDSASHPFLMASGNYSNKFHANDTAAAIGAARKIRDKLLARAAQRLEASPDDLELREGRVY